MGNEPWGVTLVTAAGWLNPFIQRLIWAPYIAVPASPHRYMLLVSILMNLATAVVFEDTAR